MLVVIEGVDNVFIEGLGAPEVVYTAIVLVALTGFPAVLILAWLLDVTSRGIERTEPSDSKTGRSFKIAGLIGASVLAILAGWWWFLIRG